jgi:hypothetical protein
LYRREKEAVVREGADTRRKVKEVKSLKESLARTEQAVVGVGECCRTRSATDNREFHGGIELIAE